MALGSYAQRNSCNNFLANPTGEPNELAGSQSLVRKSDANKNKVSTYSEVLTYSETLISSLISPTKDLFMKFIKAFVESI